jgi:hypothetical protein
MDTVADPGIAARVNDTPKSARIARLAFLFLIALECAPFWLFNYFPSQDGPSHLHNLMVVANYRAEPVYQQYYRVTGFQPAGNMLTQWIQGALIKVTGPRAAEKLILSGYIVLFFFAFRYLLAVLTPYADWFALYAAILAPNLFLYLGFWNFCFSITLMLFTFGYAIRAANRHWGWRQHLLLGAMGVLLYLTHIVSWGMCILGVAAFGMPRLVIDLRARVPLRAAIGRYLSPLAGLLAPLILFLVYFAGARVKTAQGADLRQSLWTLYSFSFLHSVAPRDELLAKFIAMLVAIAFVFACILAWKRRLFWRDSGLLIAGAVCGLATVFGPDSAVSGSYLHVRVAFFAWLFVALWLVTVFRPVPAAALYASTAVLTLLALAVFAVRLPVLAHWDRELAELVRVGQSIRPESTVLTVRLERTNFTVDPMLHAVGLLSDRNIVDLANYEASVDYFATQFRPERNPFPALGSLSQLESAPGVFDIARYESTTQGHVDYILFYANRPEAKNARPPELDIYGDRIAPFSLVTAGNYGPLRLYRRRENTPAAP